MSRRRPSVNESTRGRAFVVSLVGGLTLLVLAITVFAVASQARSVSHQAEQSVRLVEARRVVSIARADLSIASVLSNGTNRSEVLAATIANADAALDAVEADFDDQTSSEVRLAFAKYRDAANAQAEIVLADPIDAEAVIDGEIAAGEAFDSLSTVLQDEQVQAQERLSDDNDLMNMISTISTFVVAFVVPSAALYIFEALRRTPRRTRQLEHDHENTTATSLAMAGAVSKEAAHLRRIIEDVPELQNHAALRRSVLRFEHVAALNGSVRTLHNVEVDLGELAMEVTRSIGYPVAIDIDQANEAVVLGDYEQISLVMVELLHNAISHGTHPIGIEISTEDQLAIVIVTDSGPGLPEAIEDAIIHDNDYATRGNLLSGTYGFGLLAAREATESLGGVLRYHRHEGETAMIVELPKSHFANRAKQTDTSLPAALEGRSAA